MIFGWFEAKQPARDLIDRDGRKTDFARCPQWVESCP